MEENFPAYKGSDAFIFVSYSHADRKMVLPELQRLREYGFNIWYDEGIVPGSSWREEIAQAIRGASAFIFFVTPKSSQSEHCQKEAYFALDLKCPVICIYLQSTELPDGLRMALNDRQAIKQYELADDVYSTKLLEGLEGLIPNKVPAPEPEIEVPQHEDNGVPRVLVLPITNLGQILEDDFFIEGLTEDLVAGLALSRWLMVIDSATSFSFLGKKVDPRKVAMELNAAYVVHGRMRKSGHRIRTTFYLTNVKSSTVIWTQQFDCDVDELFLMEDEIKHHVLSAIEPEYLNNQSVTIENRHTDLAQWELLVKARQVFWKTSRDSTIEARELLQQIMVEDRSDARVWALLAMTHMNDAWNGWSASIKDSLSLAEWASEQALKIDDKDPGAHHVRSTVRCTLGDLSQAEADLSRALQLNPYFAAALGDMARVRVFSGRLDGAIEFAKRAISASPRDPHIGLWYYWIALIYFVDQDYLRALPWLEKAITIRPDWYIFNRLKTVCLALLGRKEKAQETLRLVSVPANQDFEAILRANHPFEDEEPLTRYLEGLKIAGVNLAMDSGYDTNGDFR